MEGSVNVEGYSFVILLSFFVLFGRREIRRIFLSKEKFEEADNNIVSLVVS